MLYKLAKNDAGKFDKINPLSFKDFSYFGNLEKDLEDLIANNIFGVLFEDSSLMPVFQERRYKGEADIYALNEKGDIVIFELKRGAASEDAVLQALRYAQDVGQWGFSKLQNNYKKYTDNDNADILRDHSEAFNLEHQLEKKELNSKQHLFIIGSAADKKLIYSIDYWRNNGVSINFLPYRVYELNGEKYFEFFALPYDIHMNPGEAKGVLFDTNRSYDENSIWYMMKNKCVAAFGDAKRFVEYIYTNDVIFFSHKGLGLIAAAKVVKGDIKKPDNSTYYRDVDFLTPIPIEGKDVKCLSFRRVSEITGKSFYWARTIKVPYLSMDEAEILLKELKSHLEFKK